MDLVLHLIVLDKDVEDKRYTRVDKIRYRGHTFRLATLGGHSLAETLHSLFLRLHAGSVDRLVISHGISSTCFGNVTWCLIYVVFPPAPTPPSTRPVP